MELKEGAIFAYYKLGECLLNEPAGAIFHCTSTDNAQTRWLIKICSSVWRDRAGYNCSFGFAFKPGRFIPWRPSPADLLADELYMLRSKLSAPTALMKPVADGSFEGWRYAVYQSFQGVQLSSMLRQEAPVKFSDLAVILKAVADLHAADIHHGCLSPENIIVGRDRVLLMNCTSHAVKFDPYTNELLTVLTDPRYYPLADPRGDQLALGLILYEALTRLHPLSDRAKGTYCRAGVKLQALLNSARERGVNRFFSPFLRYQNPAVINRKISQEAAGIVSDMIGMRRSAPNVIDAVPGSWLWPAQDGMFMTIRQSAEALSALKDQTESESEAAIKKWKEISQKAARNLGMDPTHE